MAPPWLPQNIQKKIFQYILSRLQIFSNLDLSNIDVSLEVTQTPLSLSLNNVQLDTDKLSFLSGLFVRHGTIKNLELKYAVLGGVRIEGSGIHLTASLTHKILDDKDEIASLLARTTADFANSILISDDLMEASHTMSKTELMESITSASASGSFLSESDAASESGAGLGYGLGDFTGFYNRVTDAALSQLNVVLRNIKIRLILEDVTVDVVINKFKLNTNDAGLRQISISDFEWILVSSNEDEPVIPNANLGRSANTPQDMLHSIYHDAEPSLSESILFSHADASSLYMSAVSAIPEGVNSTTPKPRPRLFWCESLLIKFPGLDFSSLEIDIGKTNIALKHFPSVLLPLVDFLRTHQRHSKGSHKSQSKHASSKSKQSSHNTDDSREPANDKFNISHLRVSNVEINLSSSMLPHGLFESESNISLELESVNFHSKDKAEMFFDIGKILVKKSDTFLLQFSQGNDDTRADLSGHVFYESGSQIVKFTLPFEGNLLLSLDDLLSLEQFWDSFKPVFAAFATLSSSIDQQKQNHSFKLVGQTNLFKASFTLDKSSIKALVFPVSFEGNSTISIPKVILNISPNNVVELRNLVYHYQHESLSNSIKIESAHTRCNIKEMTELGEEFSGKKRQYKAFTKQQRFSPTPTKLPNRRQPKGIQKGVYLSISIKYIELQVTLPSRVQTLTIDLGHVNFHASITGNHVVSIFSLHISRDMSDIDESLGYLNLLHSVNDKSQPTPLIKFRIGDGGAPQKVSLFNLAVEYHPKLLELFEKSEEKSPQSNGLSTPQPTTGTSDIIDIPISLQNCMIGLSPLHLPSHGLFLIDKGSTHITLDTFGKLSVDASINKGTLYIIDDMSTQKPITLFADGRNRPSADSHFQQAPADIGSQFAAQGYSLLATANDVSIKLSVCPSPDESLVALDLKIESVYMRSCADSTHNLVQLINDLKPPLDIPPFEERYQINPVLSDPVFENIDYSIFQSKQSGAEKGSFDAHADFICDDVPANLEFVESYYADHHSSRSQWASSPSASLTTSYTNTDILLEQDLSELVSQNHIGDPSKIVEFNNHSARKLGSFEQRAQSHDSTLSITEDHFGKREPNEPHEPQPDLPSKYKITGQESSRSQMLENSSAPRLGNVTKDREAHEIRNKEPTVSLAFEIKSVTWDLHDGFDWGYTRDIINSAVSQVEDEVFEVREEKNRMQSTESSETFLGEQQMPQQSVNTGDEHNDSDQDEVVGGVLFNSIYIGMSTHQGSSDLRKRINEELHDDDYSDTNSQISSPFSTKSSHKGSQRSQQKGKKQPLKLKRSKHHKVQIALKNVSGTVHLFSGINDEPSLDDMEKSDYGGDKAVILNRILLKVADMEILDNVQTSTWNKFLTYMRSAGERESGASMLRLQMENVKPIPRLPTSEIILSVHVLPLRLHVDQDTLDFITRFFEFKDDRFDSLIDPLQVELPFIQKVDIRDIPVKLDYKPKKIDYAGLRSGHTTEFMNFFILDEAEMVLRHITLYGIAGFPRMGKELNNIWMPDIKKNQLGDVLSGLAPVRSLVKIGTGIRDLVVVPVREYKKDGRIVRSIQKGAWQFARNTSNELVKFGAKLAVGTQTMLENAEQAMGGAGSAGRVKKAPPRSSINQRDYNVDGDDETVDFQTTAAVSKQGVRFATNASPKYTSTSEQASSRLQRGATVSLYADQPRGVKQGLQSAYDSLGRNLSIAKNAVAEIKTEAVRSGSAQGAAIAVVKAAPIAIIRPMIGATEAVSRTLLGVTNQMDPEQLRDIEEKYRGDSADQL